MGEIDIQGVVFLKNIGTRDDALEAALFNKADTFFQLTESTKRMGRNKNGLWDVTVPYQSSDIVNFILYEKDNGRKVAIWSESKEYIDRALQELINFNKGKKIKSIESLDTVLCHSTSRDNIYPILSSGYLKSYTSLVQEGIAVDSVRGILREPSDYNNLIDFGGTNSLAPEIVVASRSFGRIKEDIDFYYDPGVRMYFKLEDLIQSGRFVQDGLHIGRVREKLSVDRIWKIVIPFKEEFLNEISKRKITISEELKEKIIFIHERELWKPLEFIEYANEVVFK